MKKKKKRKSINREFTIITYLFLFMMLCLTGYFVYFVQFNGSEFTYSAYNTRNTVFSEAVVRGSILSNDGDLLAYTQTNEKGKEERVYPYDEAFSHIVGYTSNGMSGLELSCTGYLNQCHNNTADRIQNDLDGIKNIGDEIYTTLDVAVQTKASEAMGSYRGAVVAIEPSTGKILAVVSKPDYDPNKLDAIWDFITDDNSGSTVLLNRATQGLYPPGSTFKIFTTLAYLKQHDASDFSYNCNGSRSAGDFTIHCAGRKSHGTVDLKKAFGESCNCSFATIGLSLDLDKYYDTCENLLFNEALPVDLANTKKSSFTLKDTDDKKLIGQTAMGQGNTLVSPFHMALICSAIANDGTLMKPYLIDRVQSEDGNVVKQFKPSNYKRLMTEDEADTLSKYMRYVVTKGTADKINTDLYDIYGKTGSAEFSSSKSNTHSWFVGFAKDEYDKEIAIAVIVEEVGSGSKYAAPIAKQVFDAYFGYSVEPIDFEDYSDEMD